MRFASIILTALVSICAVASPLPLDNSVNGGAAVAGHTVNVPKSFVGRAPPVPSINDMKKHMHTQADMANKALFYSGPGGYAKKANDLAKKTGRKLLKDFWIDSKYPDAWQNDIDASKQFFDNASAAMAQVSSGVVYVLLPSDTKGTKWNQDTVWAREEWPNLGNGKNPAVTKIVRVNPDNSNEETIYTK